MQVKTRAALLAPGAGAIFFLSYGFATWVTAQRHHVPSIAFGWEHGIPFLPGPSFPTGRRILLYAASLFLCRTRHELNTHAKRLLAVQILSVAVFLLYPLRFSFERPAVTGLFGGLFDS